MGKRNYHRYEKITKDKMQELAKRRVILTRRKGTLFNYMLNKQAVIITTKEQWQKVRPHLIKRHMQIDYILSNYSKYFVLLSYEKPSNAFSLIKCCDTYEIILTPRKRVMNNPRAFYYDQEPTIIFDAENQ